MFFRSEEDIEIPGWEVKYSALGVKYTIRSYTAHCQPELVPTDRSCHETRDGLKKGRISLPGEELYFLLTELDGHDLESPDELLGKRKSSIFWQFTDAFLRVPAGTANPAVPDYKSTNGGGFYWLREFGFGRDAVAGKVLVPEWEGRETTASLRRLGNIDMISGIPVRLEPESDSVPDTLVKFTFNPDPPEDPVTKRKDVGIVLSVTSENGRAIIHIDATYFRHAGMPNCGYGLIYKPGMPRVYQDTFYNDFSSEPLGNKERRDYMEAMTRKPRRRAK
jgi:hypothetical protein